MSLYYFLKFFLFKRNIIFFLFVTKVIFFALFEMIGIFLLVTLITILSGNHNSQFVEKFFIIVENITSLDLSNITNLSLITLSFYLFKAVYSIYFIRYQQTKIANAHRSFCNKIFENYASGDNRLTRKFKSYELIRNINFVSDKVFGEYCVSIFNLITEATVVAVLFTTFVLIDFKLAIGLLIIGYLIIKILTKLIFSKSEIIGQKSLNAYGELIHIVNITIGLFKELRLLKLLNIFKKNFNNTVTKYVEAKKYDNYISRIPVVVIELFVVTVIVFLIIFQLNGEQKFVEAIPKLSLFAIGIARLTPSINRISTNLHTIKFYTPSVMSLMFDYHFLNKANQDNVFVKKVKFKKLITFKNVDLAVFGEVVLNKINFTIKKGEKVLIYGASGSGKTSIINILSGFSPYDGGCILIDEKIQKHKIELINPISLVSQENNLINNETIYYNVTKKNKKKSFKDKKFNEITKICDLEKFINYTTNKEHNIISENAKNISGGEKQRICIARSLYSDFDILLMDEPFSSIDKLSSDKIFKKILTKFKTKTIVIVSHQNVNEKFIDKIIKVKKND